MATLYRKYRPQNFTEVVGQNHIKMTLEHEIQSGRTAHAYIFCGPRAVGKTTLARVLAKAVNCEKRKKDEYEPCNKCSSCVDITEGKNIDIIEIDAASHTGVDNVRENIIASARVAPVKSKYKVFIIDEVHMLSASAFNALLKIIEEPPTFVMFILCTTEIHKVPTTIISRCQRFDFKRIGITDMTKKLNYIVDTEGIKVGKDILESVARQSDGHMRDAESMLGQIVAIGGKEISQEEADLVIPRSDVGEIINLIEYLSRKDAANAIKLVNRLIDEGVDLKNYVEDAIEILRKMLLTKVNAALADKLGLELGEALEIKINEVAKNLNQKTLTVFIEKFIMARNDLKNSFIIQLPLELAIIELCEESSYANTANASASSGNVKFSPAEPKRVDLIAKNIIKEGVVESVTMEEVMEKWNEVLVKIKKYNHSLSFVLKVCEPREVRGNKICLAFKYKFHKDRMNDANIRAIMEKVFMEVYNAALSVEAIIDENLEVAGGDDVSASEPVKKEAESGDDKAEGGNMIDNLLKTFGGKVVG